MLRLRCAAAVPDGEEPASAEQDAREVCAPVLEAHELALKRGERRRQRGKVCAEALGRRHVTASFHSRAGSASSSR